MGVYRLEPYQKREGVGPTWAGYVGASDEGTRGQGLSMLGQVF